MSFLNANFPTLRVFVRNNFVHGGPGCGVHPDKPTFIEGDVVGVKSLQGRALGFHVLFRDGALFWNLPVHALAWKEHAAYRELSELQLWDCASYEVAVTTFDRLPGADVRVRLGKGWEGGAYVTTVDWAAPGPDRIDTTLAELPEEAKCAHLVALADGNYCLQPNNRVRFVDKSFTTAPFHPTYRTQTREWVCERGGWQAEDTDRVYYDIEKVMEGSSDA